MVSTLEMSSRRESGFTGDGVNIAARIEGLADGGGICVSGSAYEQIENKLALGYEYFGEHTVKNITKPIKVYKVPMELRVNKKKAGSKGWKKVVFVAAAALILGAGALAAWHLYIRPAPPPTEVASEKTPAPESPDETQLPVSDVPSVAVLPFANISGDPKEDYLSDGITEQIISALSKIPRMSVVARNSVFTYKGKPVMVQQVSEELGVRYVLEGSVQKSGDRLRITAQLIDAKTGNHLWSERYDRELKNLFDLQDDITKNVITALQVKLTQGETAPIYGKGTKNLKAYLKQMKGLYHHFHHNKNDNEIARRLFEEAIALDPNFANAYITLAWTYWVEAHFGWTETPAKSYEKAMELAKKALSLDKLNGLVYTLLANVYAKTGQFQKAMAAGKKAISLDAANSNINALYGRALFHLGEFQEAIPFLKKAIRKDPKPPSWYLAILGASYYQIFNSQEAVPLLKEAIRKDPKPPSWYLAVLGASYNNMGNFKEAIPFLKKAVRMDPDPPSWYQRELDRSYGGMGSSYYNTGMSYYKSGKYKEAIPFLKEANRIAPTISSYCLELLGYSYYKTGKFKEAIPVLKRAINLSSYNLEAHVGLAAAYSLAGRMEDARAQAAEVLKINPKITLEDIAKNDYYNFQKADKERFINALRKAGLK